MDKQFTCTALCLDYTLDGAVDLGFGFSIGNGLEDRDYVRARFDALDVGETLNDEDDDTWTRIA